MADDDESGFDYRGNYKAAVDELPVQLGEPAQRNELHLSRVRLAQRDDVPVILSLIRELAEYERAPNEVIATEDQLRENLFGAHPGAEVLIGEEAGQPVGFALFVRPTVRGKGYGRALLVRLAELARDRDCGRMEWAVLDWNKPAIQFYLKLGARPNEEWSIYRLTREGIERLAEAG